MVGINCFYIFIVGGMIFFLIQKIVPIVGRSSLQSIDMFYPSYLGFRVYSIDCQPEYLYDCSFNPNFVEYLNGCKYIVLLSSSLTTLIHIRWIQQTP